MLAGISVDYYLRVEQGSRPNPSVQVLESLARLLLLDDDTTAYLLRLGSAKPDVLAANAQATPLSPRLVAGGNRLRDVFLDPDPGPTAPASCRSSRPSRGHDPLSGPRRESSGWRGRGTVPPTAVATAV